MGCNRDTVSKGMLGAEMCIGWPGQGMDMHPNAVATSHDVAAPHQSLMMLLPNQGLVVSWPIPRRTAQHLSLCRRRCWNGLFRNVRKMAGPRLLVLESQLYGSTGSNSINEVHSCKISFVMYQLVEPTFMNFVLNHRTETPSLQCCRELQPHAQHKSNSHKLIPHDPTCRPP